MTDRLYWWLRLRAVRGLGERSIKKLFLRWGDPEVIFKASWEELSLCVGPAKAEAIRRGSLSFDPEKVLSLVDKEGIRGVTLGDPLYPKLLAQIDDPPPVIFYIGELKPFEGIGVVGTRNPHPYSLKFTHRLVEKILEAGYAVVSGGARGIDQQAHHSCLDMGGYTLCFAGMGVLKAAEVLKSLVKKGAVLLSELLPHEGADIHTYPRRNRLISGSSHMLVVVEAGETSGALITAKTAHVQRRPVWAHVGYGFSERWRGCIKLVNEGMAKLLAAPEDLLLEGSKPVKHTDPLLSLLELPRTLEDLVSLTGEDPVKILQQLTLYEMRGLVTKQGAYYMLT
ncbi:DNA protecting protein DprA [Thermocrinis albus DSM 14484]|uniref:DNA protecting protein DprA n=1 Tax=Thermocrinis albus (strain DSM 14484 / JCM 11386 / HI 11/12) TaxID=638303 RepID=D3SLN8_THEAH|nr:DNA-processing protein DprA [Thermocrinis albus]ADC89668.1 DNA protecting protein DprA [Thermocrinis albus DSM 14484]